MVTSEQRKKILELLALGVSKSKIAKIVGITSKQVDAVEAWVTMGKYNLEDYKPSIDIKEVSTILEEIEKEETKKKKYDYPNNKQGRH
jgi:transcriptional regulator